ncbi:MULTISPECIES: gamma-glutamyl-gamma-aminobutyrate hydrolase family protein [unclassified Nitratiruptor]|uniref:gamma-glutamyl-gamma-aminobutyrate hydrolase family protein n=1 Tax=unclassified Nitratiruptor TaxID=2624044 RepID=UPI00191682E3|nr:MULTISPECIES: gamma-glutamyl-gamma-aminobutyrate hydrolase family protein [unclassified Nitratiruptor]BCD60685.1 putative glutamine amidotransferase [Nitratiruptor sp. YY08-10]BCD64616.1 putative glutamine amidotransferase [Nitratiruptor sp. YY08-14]
MARKKQIVVTGSRYKNRNSWLFIHFLLKLFHAKPIFIHPDSTLPKDFDALLIGGGTDICPKEYGLHQEWPCEEKRDKIELELFHQAFDKKLPIFGICRGMQLINVALGGSLHPNVEDLDLEYQHPYTPFPLQTITILPHTKLYSILQTSTIKANALHHQAINVLGKDLRIAAKDRNGIIQAIEHEKLPILGIQWHPEYLPYMHPHRKFFKYIVNTLK